MMEKAHLKQYLDLIVSNEDVKKAKPDPEMYWMGCRELGLKPEECASVADNLSRDITGAKRAGIGANILFISPEKLAKKTITDENRPDRFITHFSQLLEFFPPLR